MTTTERIMTMPDYQRLQLSTPCWDAVGRSKRLAVRATTTGEITMITPPGESATLPPAVARRFLEDLHRMLYSTLQSHQP